MIRKLKSLFSADSSKGSFMRATSMLAGGTAAGQLVVWLAGPIVSRLYTPAQFGTLATFSTILSCIAPIACLRYEAALSLPKEEEKANKLLYLCLVSALFVSICTAVFVAIARGWLSNIFHDPGLKPFLWILPVSLFGVGVYQAFNYWAVRQREFGLAARTKIIQGGAQAVSQIGLGLVKMGAFGLILGDVLGRILGAGSIATLAWKSSKGAFAKTTWDEAKGTAVEYQAFPLVSGPATLLHTATSNFTIVLASLYGPALYGLYFFGINKLWSPVAVVGQAMAQVYLGEASRWAREDPAKMLRAFDMIVKRLALFGAVPFGILMALGGPLTALIFGWRWYEAGILVQIQALSWWVMFVVGPVLNTLNILGRQSWQLCADAGGIAMMVGVFWASWKFGWDARLAVALYSGAIILMYIWLFVACRRAIVINLESEPTNDR